MNNKHRDEFFGSKADFQDRFVTNESGSSGWKLKADGCSKRFQPENVWRDNELMSDKLSKRREFNTRYNNAEFNESNLMNCVITLKNKGFNDLKVDESIEEFVERHMEVLNGDL